MTTTINKNLLKISFLVIIALSFILLSPITMKASELKDETLTPMHKAELLKNKVDPAKVDKLIKKMEKGVKLDSDKYLEQFPELTLASSENQYYRKDFSDGSFFESEIEDITEDTNNENTINPLGIGQIGGTQEYRTLRVSHTAPWGFQAFTVKIHFPQLGYSTILQAYDWYYLGAVSSVDYRNIYRKKETATQDAVAIQRLQVGVKGVSFIAKFDFRMRGGKYWTVYKS